MERTIKVTGKGKIAVKPDTIRLIITQSSTEKDYEKAIKESAEKKESLNDALGKLGFDRSALKTLYFNVDTEYESYQERDNSWKQRLVGYRYTHRMKLEFPSDNEMLGKVLNVIAKCPGQPEFTIQYTISDPESAKNELLAKAIEDSKVKAAVLCKAAELALGEIITIDYSWEEIDFVVRPVNELMMRKCCDDAIDEGVNLDIEADDIEVTDKVTVVWGIR